MNPYEPRNHRATYDAHNGREIWDFITQHDNLVRMETASYLRRPAVEPLSPYLLKRFGDSIRIDEVKRMIGHMAKQALEQRGYKHDQHDVKITRDGNMFSRASRYAEASG